MKKLSNNVFDEKTSQCRPKMNRTRKKCDWLINSI